MHMLIINYIIPFLSKQYFQLNKVDVLFVISSIGYNITRPIALRYGSHDYDSLQISHSEVQSSIQKIKVVHNLLVKLKSNKVINLLFLMVSTRLGHNLSKA